ncbi:lysozyme inhibitor LprI family protein [Desulfococcus sp.]|uniref:lysozyme inhibitor LprI family protein n=1 Tax=Desulfococcus sp. TaxID=2025834 RepID=UPI0035934FA8
MIKIKPDNGAEDHSAPGTTHIPTQIHSVSPTQLPAKENHELSTPNNDIGKNSSTLLKPPSFNDNYGTSPPPKSQPIQSAPLSSDGNQKLPTSSDSTPEERSIAFKRTDSINKEYHAYSASFDCKKASTKSEKLICSNPQLSAADGQLAEVYSQVREQAIDQEWLKKDQLSWMKYQRDTCSDALCMLNSYKTRIDELNTFFTTEYFKTLSPALTDKIKEVGQYFNTSGDAIFRKFCIIKNTVKLDHRERLATLITYPIKVNLNGIKTQISSNKEFIENYHNIITPQVKDAVAQQEFTDIFYRDIGIMFGNGAIWFDEKAIISINN